MTIEVSIHINLNDPKQAMHLITVWTYEAKTGRNREVEKPTATGSNLVPPQKMWKICPLITTNWNHRKNLKDINKMRDIPCSLIGRLSIVSCNSLQINFINSIQSQSKL